MNNIVLQLQKNNNNSILNNDILYLMNIGTISYDDMTGVIMISEKSPVVMGFFAPCLSCHSSRIV